MADLAVAHLAGWQSDRLARGLQAAVGPGVDERTPGGHPGCGDGVCLRPAAEAEAVEHEEDDRTGAPLGHEAARRAWAVRAARATMPAISSTLRLAPPTRAPSNSGSAMNASMVALVTLPP